MMRQIISDLARLAVKVSLCEYRVRLCEFACTTRYSARCKLKFNELGMLEAWSGPANSEQLPRELWSFGSSAANLLITLIYEVFQPLGGICSKEHFPNSESRADDRYRRDNRYKLQCIHCRSASRLNCITRFYEEIGEKSRKNISSSDKYLREIKSDVSPAIFLSFIRI